MVFKITSCAYDSLRTHGSAVLLISIEDQICLKSIPGWEPNFSEEINTVSTLPSKSIPDGSTNSKSSDEVCKRPAITNCPDVERVKRKLLDELDGLTSSKNVSGDGVHKRYAKFPGHKSPNSGTVGLGDIGSSSKRPRSLPDFRDYVKEGHCGDSVVPYNGKESIIKENHRLESLARKSLQKGSPVSRSLNSISDIESAQMGIRADLRNKSVQFRSPGRTAGGKPSGVTPVKRSCVRRLNLDDVVLTQDSGDNEKDKLQSSVGRRTVSVDSSQQDDSETGISKLAVNKHQHSNRNLHTNLRDASKDRTLSQSGNTPSSSVHVLVGSQPFRIGPETQRVLMNDFGDDSFCISEKPKSVNNKDATSKNASIGLLVNAYKGKISDVNYERDNIQTSEELFSESQSSVCQERDKTGHKNEHGLSQRTESLYHNLKHLNTTSSVKHRTSHFQSQGLQFSATQIKSMCDVIFRLYGPQE